MLPDLPRRLTSPPDVRPEVYNYQIPDDGKEHHVVYTGPGAVGLVQLADGTLYDVTRHYIDVECDGHEPPDENGVMGAALGKCHASEVSHHIALQHEVTGRYDSVVPETGEVIRFQHSDCPHCDAPDTLHLETPAERTAAVRDFSKAKHEKAAKGAKK